MLKRPGGLDRVTGSSLIPNIVHVRGRDRFLLEDEPSLAGPAAYIATYGVGCVLEAYVGMTGCGQDRPRLGPHLAKPRTADDIYVITDVDQNLSEDDARVLERFFVAQLDKVTDWALLYEETPWARGVGPVRFGDLIQFGCTALRLLKLHFGLFETVSERVLVTPTREHEQILYDLLRNGVPKGREMTLEKVGVVAHGVLLESGRFVVKAGSQVRSLVVESGIQLNGARREELFFNGHLKRVDNALFVVHRDLEMSSATAAARFVTGSTATASDWRPAHLRLV
jgi:hypothetical protein